MLYLIYTLLFAALLSSLCLSTNADSGVTFVYPNASSHLTFNYLDTVKVIYSTPWPNVNLEVYCLDSTHSQYYDYYQTYDNPLDQSGIVTIQHIGDPSDLTGILQYPTPCWFKIADSRLGNGDDVPGVVGGNFSMKSVDGLPIQTWSAGVTPTGINAGATVTVTTTPSSSLSSASSSSLSTGAKAGIGVSVGVLCVGMASLAIYIFMLRRRLHLQDEEVKKLNAIKGSRDYRDVNDSRFTRKELPTPTVPPTFEADEGQPTFEAEGQPAFEVDESQLAFEVDEGKPRAVAEAAQADA